MKDSTPIFDLTPLTDILAGTITQLNGMVSKTLLKETFSEYKKLLKDEKYIKAKLENIKTAPYYKVFGSSRERQKDTDRALDNLRAIKVDQAQCLEILIGSASEELNKLKASL